eukprot:5597742-Pyramimonas_sp.AAC.1
MACTKDSCIGCNDHVNGNAEILTVKVTALCVLQFSFWGPGRAPLGQAGASRLTIGCCFLCTEVVCALAVTGTGGKQVKTSEVTLLGAKSNVTSLDTTQGSYAA